MIFFVAVAVPVVADVVDENTKLCTLAPTMLAAVGLCRVKWTGVEHTSTWLTLHLSKSYFKLPFFFLFVFCFVILFSI